MASKRPLLFLILKARGLERIRTLHLVMQMLAVGRKHVNAHLEALEKRLKERQSYAEAILGYPHPRIDHGIRRLKQAKAANPKLRKALEGV
jgi:hypothetical protein